MFQFEPITSGPVTGHHWKYPGCVFITSSFHTLMLFDVLRSCGITNHFAFPACIAYPCSGPQDREVPVSRHNFLMEAPCCTNKTCLLFLGLLPPVCVWKQWNSANYLLLLPHIRHTQGRSVLVAALQTPWKYSYTFISPPDSSNQLFIHPYPTTTLMNLQLLQSLSCLSCFLNPKLVQLYFTHILLSRPSASPFKKTSGTDAGIYAVSLRGEERR